MIVCLVESGGKSGCGRGGGRLEYISGESEKVGNGAVRMEFWSDWTLKVSVGTGNTSELLGLGAARFARIVLRSAGEIVKLRSGARRP